MSYWLPILSPHDSCSSGLLVALPYATDGAASVCLELLFEATLAHLSRGDWGTQTDNAAALFHLTVQVFWAHCHNNANNFQLVIRVFLAIL